MKIKITLVLCVLICFSKLKSQTYAASNFTLISLINPEPNANTSGDRYSACWGWYQASKNKEYAIACSQTGTYWVDVTLPATPTVSAYKVGAHTNATWREVKTYQNFCYVASDDGGTNRFQIFDMQYLPDSVSKVYDSQAIFKRGHTLYVDGNKLYVASVTYSNNSFSSMNVYSLANPANPTLLRRLDQDFPLINHVHDMYVRNDTVYASCGYGGLYVFRLTAANTFTVISSLTAYPFSGYNHSSALTPNGQTLVFLDEVPASLPIKVANVSNLSNIQVVSTINQYSLTTPHNPFIVNNQYCFVSSYQDGLQLFDISNPSSPFLAGYFDTYPQGGGNINSYLANNDYEGQWGAYPFFPSKNIFALDQKNGIFMLKSSLYANPAPSPTVSYISQGTVCAGSLVSYSNTTVGATAYVWTFPGGSPPTSTLASPVVTYSATGNYNVLLSAFNGTAFSSSNGTVQVVKVISTLSSTNVSCAGCSNGSASVSATGGTAPYSYSWTPNVGTTASVNNLSEGCYTVVISDANLCTATKTLCLSFAVGIQNLALNEKDLLVYPNPAKNNVSVEIPSGPFNYALYSVSGELLMKGSSSSNKTLISLHDFSKGVYLLEVELNNYKVHKKLIID